MDTSIPFIKMHGCGNDYIFVDVRHRDIDQDLSELARHMSDRRRGIGSDGLVLIHGSERAAARMQILNADGSEAETCGTALRCIARLLFQEQGTTDVAIDTARDVRAARLDNGPHGDVAIDMGKPILKAAAIPTTLGGNPPLSTPLDIGGTSVDVTCVSMGNPHCVVFVPSVDEAPVESLGRRIECHPVFPNRTNVEFVEVVDRRRLKIRIHERGSGETEACGTGACAAVVAGSLTGICERTASVGMPGGELRIDWEDEGTVLMTGPAVEVFRGVFELT